MASKPVVMWCPIIDSGDGEEIVTCLDGSTEENCRQDYLRAPNPHAITVRFARVTVSELRDCEVSK